MLKQEITFPDLDDNPVTETFYFNINEAELIKFNFTNAGGMYEFIQKIIREKDEEKLYNLFESLLTISVGVRSENNIDFIKTPEIVRHFTQSNAYSTLLMQMSQDAELVAEFFKKTLPSRLQKQIEDAPELPFDGEVVEGTVTDDRPAWIREDRMPTPSELQTMTQPQLQEAFAKRLKNES